MLNLHIKKIVKKIKLKIQDWLGINPGPTVDDMIKMGMTVGENFFYDASCRFDSSHCWLISIGSNVTFGPGVYLLAHDASTKSSLGYTKIGKITISDNVFIGADTIVMPGVTIGKGSIIGAGSVVTKSVPDDCVFAGNPARMICKAADYLEKQREKMNELPLFDESFTLRYNVSPDKKKQMIEEMREGKGFIV